MADPNLPLLQDAAQKLAPFLDEIVFVGGVTLGLLIEDQAAAPIRATTDIDVIAEIITYADYVGFLSVSTRLVLPRTQARSRLRAVGIMAI